MKQKLRIWLTALLAAGLTVGGLPAALAAEPLPADENFYYDPVVPYEYDPLLPTVQLNGEQVEFEDAEPAFSNGRLMVPFRRIAEALGGTVKFVQPNSVESTVGAVTLRLSIGSDKLLRTENGVQETIPMDTAPYIRGGRTYVPVRFFAEALGLTVEWSDWEYCAVLYDAARLTAEANEGMSVLNACLAGIQDGTQNDDAVQRDLSVALHYTAFDTLDGNTEYSFNGTMTTIENGQAKQMTIRLDLGALSQLIFGETDGFMQQQLTPYASQLKNAKIEILYDMATDTAYLRSPLLLTMMGASDGQKDAWLKIEQAGEALGVGTPTVTDLLQEKSKTVGQLLLDRAEKQGYPEDIWQNVTTQSALLRHLFGDDALTGSGDRYTAKLNINALESEIEEEQELYYQFDITKLSGNVQLQPESGKIGGDIVMRGYGMQEETETKVQFSLGAAAGTLSGTMHERNTGLADFSIRYSAATSAQQPMKTPPLADTVITMDNLP